MSYQVIDAFAAGLDTRKSPLTSAPGTLSKLVNAAITPGGEIQKRRAFVKVADVPGSFGLAATQSAIYVFGRNVLPTVPALGVPGVTLVPKLIPNSDSTLRQTDFDIYAGKIYLACATGSSLAAAPTKAQNPHYYDGKLTEGAGKGYYVRTYQTKVYSVLGQLLSFSVIDNPMLWESNELLESVPVISMTNAKPPVLEVDSADIGKFTSGGAAVIDGTTGTGMSIDGLHNISSVNSPANTFRLTYADTSSGTAPQVGGIRATPGILADLSNTNPAVVTVSLADIVKFTTGSTIRGFNATGLLAVANGLHAITNINNATGTFNLVGVNTAAAAAGTTNYVVALDSGVPRTGAGYITLSKVDADSELLTSLEVYYDKLAIFSSKAVQIWNIDPDPAQNAFDQLLRAAGTTAPRSPLMYGSGDVLYLDPSGIRSLKAKDSSNSAAVSDVGSPVDPTIQGYRTSFAAGEMDKAISLLEPNIGRFWMVFPTRILVLSYFPGPNVTAWSEYTLPELGAAKVEYAVVGGGRVFLRDNLNQIWVYGGPSGDVYNNCGVDVRLPYLDGKKPGHKKTFEAIDATVNGTTGTPVPTGAWRVAISYDFTNPEAEETVATIVVPTWNIGRNELQGYDSHFSLRFYNNDSLPATISNVAVHYSVADAEA